MKALLLITAFASSAFAQLLTSGTTQLPACGLQCTAMNQAVAACGGESTSTQQNWICFCQSAYLTGLKTNPPGAVCDSFCTDPAQNQQVIAWYNTQCGTDLGASEHPNNGQAATPSAAATASSTTPATSSTASSQTPSTATSSSQVSDVASTLDGSTTGDWWTGHWKWIVMIIVIILGILGLLFLLIYLKRRHARRQDSITGGFNQGITTRTAAPPTPQMTTAVVPSPTMPDSPVRTRDAFMPYGYGYSRSKTDLSQISRGSPLAHDGITSPDAFAASSPVSGKKKRVHVRERSID